jgi:pimeloyl-ACP methyl ester carboxylesterase
MRTGAVSCLDKRGFHVMRYTEWGDPANPRVLVCVHGLTRTGRDFDDLARALSDDFRVVCPDIAGRGASDWLAARTDYGYPQYMADVTALIARVTGEDVGTVDWIGTSMGGILGIFMAALPKTPIRRIVVNDAGLLVPKAALERIARYVGKDLRFASLDELDANLRRVAASFGPLTDAQWRHLATHGAKRHDDGTWGYSYDPAIAGAFDGEIVDIDLGAFWDAIRCPTLVLRGADSDVLLRETAEAMTQRGPRARLVEFAGVGHAPMLMSAEEARVIRDFLLAP